MKRKVQVLTIIIFCAFIGFFSVANFFNPDKDFSENENRVLAKFPPFSTKSLFFEQYTTKFETYFTDQFIGRDFWIPLKAMGEIAFGKLQNNNVYFGKDGYLITHMDTYKEQQLQNNINAVNKFVASNKIPTDFMLVPTANHILAEKLSPFAYDIDQARVIDTVLKQLNPQLNFIDVSTPLKEHADEEIYFKTDHHWNSLGAFYGYQQYAQSINLPYKDLADYEIITEALNFKGTQYSKSGAFWHQGDPITRFVLPNQKPLEVEYEQDGNIKEDIYSYEKLQMKDKYTFYLDGNHSITTIKTNQSEKENLLVVKDSYAHIFTPFLLSDYNEITMVDLRYYKASLSDLIETKGINRVLILYSVDNFITDGNLVFLK